MESRMRGDTHVRFGWGFVQTYCGDTVRRPVPTVPYLAAKDGGGLFLVVYIVLALTFGFTLLITEIAIGRKTKQSPLTAYGSLSKKWAGLGIVACLVPAIILPYYCVIGGWVLKYFFVYATGSGAASAADNYFTEFISSPIEPIVFMLIFMGLTAFVIYRGVNQGIEKLSKILMPLLLIFIIFIAVFSLTLTHTDEAGVTRTGLQGLGVFLIPNLDGITLERFLAVLVDAMGQLFFSLSVAMGIMITYGSYMKDDHNLKRSVNQIEIFDTAVAILAGIMIIPAVFTFAGVEGMESSGPGLLFVTMPKVFQAMGIWGFIIGIIFFAFIFFAALTSSISIMEAVTSSFMDNFKWSRNKAATVVLTVSTILALLVCFGYNYLYFELPLPNGSIAQILDVMDYLSNYLLMPLVAIGTCLLIGWFLGPDTVIDEVEKSGQVMGRKRLYLVMIKFIAPVLLAILLLKSLGLF